MLKLPALGPITTKQRNTLVEQLHEANSAAASKTIFYDARARKHGSAVFTPGRCADRHKDTGIILAGLAGLD